MARFDESLVNHSVWSPSTLPRERGETSQSSTHGALALLLMVDKDKPAAASSSHNSSSSRQPVLLPPIFPQLPPRPLYLPSSPSLLGRGTHALPVHPAFPSPYQRSPLPTTDLDFRRLLLLQTLASQHHSLLQPSTTPEFGALAPTPQSPHISSLAPTPPPTPLDSPAMRSSWAAMVEGLNAASPPAGTSSGTGSSDLRGGPGNGVGWTSEPGAAEMQMAQPQLEFWSQLVFTSSPASPASSFPLPPATQLPPSATQTLPPDPGFDWTTLFPPTTFPSSSNPSASPLNTFTPPLYPQLNPLHSTPSQAPATTTTADSSSESPPVKKSTRAKGKSEAKMEVDTEGLEREEETGSPEEIEDKRKRNTAASARFRAKKKQRDSQLQQTSAQLREKVEDLEKQAGSLKAENKWLRDLVSEKAEMDPRLLTVLRVHPDVTRSTGSDA